jgi:serine/threonine protein kinase
VVSQRIGRYELLYPLSRGGMAMVYLARDPAFERQVAIKVLPPQFTGDPQFRSRFEREAKVIAGLEHPYIVPVYDYGEDGEQPYLVMRFMPGGTLADRIAGQPMRLEQVTPIVQRLAEAIDAVHRHGIVHCDLKPSNVLFDVEGRAFLSDFGIAKLLTSKSGGAGAVLIGTPAYMSPEQCSGAATVDGRSDVYALGLILYEMFAGRHPFGDTDLSTGEVLRKQMVEPPPPLDAGHLGLPAEINSILTWALAKQPEARYATAGMLARSLSALYADAQPVSPSKPGMGPRISRPVSPVMPTPHGNGKLTTDVLRPTRPLPALASRRWLWVGLPVLLLLFLFLFWGSGAIAGWGRASTLTPTATVLVVAPPTGTATATAPPLTNTPSPTLTLTREATATPTVTASPTLAATDTPAPSATPTRRRLPTYTPTAVNTPTPVCNPPEYYDPALGRCVSPATNPPPPVVTPTQAPP